MRCKLHPRYVPTRAPRKTMAHPDGCPACLNVWEAKKVDPRSQLGTVSVELTLDEARVLLSSLITMDHIGAAAPWAAELRAFKLVLLRSMREAL